MHRFNCPSCGAEVSPLLQYSRLLSCPHCDSVVFLNGEVVELAGEQSVLAEVPSLFSLNRLFSYRGDDYIPRGKLQFSRGDSVWEEWWVVPVSGAISSNHPETELNEGHWLSVDEGDIALQTEVPGLKISGELKRAKVNSVVGLNNLACRVTEIGTGECIGIGGELPEVITIGEQHRYLHLRSQEEFFTVELDRYAGGHQVFRGHWIDPFAVKVQS